MNPGGAPDNLLFAKLIYNELFKFFTVDGMLPFKEFEFSPRTCRLVNAPIDGGIVDTNRLLERSK